MTFQLIPTSVAPTRTSFKGTFLEWQCSLKNLCGILASNRFDAEFRAFSMLFRYMESIRFSLHNRCGEGTSIRSTVSAKVDYVSHFGTNNLVPDLWSHANFCCLATSEGMRIPLNRPCLRIFFTKRT